jgi:LuxR family quorum-sensing system transcriptional regulator SolR
LQQKFGIRPLDQKQANFFLQNKLNDSLENLQGFNLSKRELECLYHFCQGRTYKEIAKILSISPRTVETHLEKLLYKTSCSNKLEMICRFSRLFADKES